MALTNEKGKRQELPLRNDGVTGSSPVCGTRLLGALRKRRFANYSETVCTTLLTGRVLATGSFVSLIMASS
jgi:hypothetical protein